MFKIGAFAVILDKDKRVLLCHRRDQDLWNLPGGGLNESESPWEGAIRETKEETGLDVVIERLSGVYFKPQKNEVVFCFLAKIIGGQLQQTDEADEIKYFSFQELPQNMSQKQIERIKDVLENKNKPVLKIQN